jgi:hypothetical protein
MASRLVVVLVLLNVSACGAAMGPLTGADAGTLLPASPDASVTAIGLGTTSAALSCQGVFFCSRNCGSSVDCLNDCLDNGSTGATQLFESLASCLDLTCPGSSGGVCNPTKPGAVNCASCVSMATSTLGPCSSQFLACNGPP